MSFQTPRHRSLPGSSQIEAAFGMPQGLLSLAPQPQPLEFENVTGIGDIDEFSDLLEESEEQMQDRFRILLGPPSGEQEFPRLTHWLQRTQRPVRNSLPGSFNTSTFDVHETLHRTFLDIQRARLAAEHAALAYTQLTEHRRSLTEEHEEKDAILFINQVTEQFEDPDTACGKECSICLEPILKDSLTYFRYGPCGHSLHSSCAKQWIYTTENATCPLCRRPYELPRDSP